MRIKFTTVATVATGRDHQIQVQLSTWRGQTTLALKPYSATIPQVFMPSGPGVSIDVAEIDELIAAISAAKAVGGAS